MNKLIFFNIVFTIFYTTNVFCGDNSINFGNSPRFLIGNVGINLSGDDGDYKSFTPSKHYTESTYENCRLNYTDTTFVSNLQLTDPIGCFVEQNGSKISLTATRGQIEAINKSLSNNSNRPVTIQDLQHNKLYSLQISETYDTINKKTTPSLQSSTHKFKTKNHEIPTTKSNPKSKTSWPALMAIKKHFTKNKWMYILVTSFATCLFIFKKIYLKS